MKKNIKKEKRQFQRFPLGITMDIRTNGQTIEKCLGSIADLSMGGMALKTNAVLEDGMCLYLKLNIPLEIRGEVRHSKPSPSGGLNRYGVRFHKIGVVTPESAKPQNFVSAKFQRPKGALEVAAEIDHAEAKTLRG